MLELESEDSGWVLCFGGFLVFPFFLVSRFLFKFFYEPVHGVAEVGEELVVVAAALVRVAFLVEQLREAAEHPVLSPGGLVHKR